jgi:L-lactate dehydrogenase
MIELSERKKDKDLNFIKTDSRNVAIVGAGAVGMSYAYSLLCRSICDKLCIIDIDRKRAEGEAADLSHGVAFAESNMKITSGNYDMAVDADILAICAGSAQRDGEDRLSLLQRNAGVVRGIVRDAINAGFNGIFLVVTNPVDIMTGIALEASGFPPERVIGSGTTLDTARLRHLLGDYFEVDPRNVHAYVMGEHGDSEFIPWSQAMVATKPVFDKCDDNPVRYRYGDLINIGENVRGAAQNIIAAKGSTCYGSVWR